MGVRYAHYVGSYPAFDPWQHRRLSHVFFITAGGACMRRDGSQSLHGFPARRSFFMGGNVSRIAIGECDGTLLSEFYKSSIDGRDGSVDIYLKKESIHTVHLSPGGCALWRVPVHLLQALVGAVAARLGDGACALRNV